MPLRLTSISGGVFVKTTLLALAMGVSIALATPAAAAAADSAGEIVVVVTAEDSALLRSVELVARFYGLNLRVVPVEQFADSREALRIQDTGLIATAISARALEGLERQGKGDAFWTKHTRGGPRIILGISSHTGEQAAKDWSDQAVEGCRASRQPTSSASFVYSPRTEWSGAMAGLETPSYVTRSCALHIVRSASVDAVLSLRDGGAVEPLVVKTRRGTQDVILIAEMAQQFPSDGTPNVFERVFARLIPYLLSIRMAAGDRGWHAPGYYANFTIDDPWLREPYGNVSYLKLLEEMKRHRFHTTIAFIPWNYDRSQTDVVALFREHPQQFSIAIHGNDHDQEEFPSLESRPLQRQLGALQQAGARMQEFTRRTGIPYDRVLIFPHKIGPAQTVNGLKSLGLLATVNSNNVPAGALPPSDSLAPLSEVTLEYGNIPSISRTHAGLVSPSEIAMRLFLENPVLLYSHEDFFRSGSGNFSPIAETVNKLQPETRWASLGEITRHLYRLRRRADGDLDVLALASEITLHNREAKPRAFHVRRVESFRPAIRSVQVDGKPIPFRREGGVLQFVVEASGASTAEVAIQYDIQAPNMAASKAGTWARVVRTLSDFRDLVLSPSPVGRYVVTYYYDSPAWLGIFMLLLGLPILALFLWILRRTFRSRRTMKQFRSEHVPPPIQS